MTAAGVYIRAAYPIKYGEEIAKWYADRAFILSVIKAESWFDENATSNAGACGLMQLMPETAAYIAQKYGVEEYDLYSAQDNIRLGCLYISYLEKRFSDRKTLLAAYNAGEGTVNGWLKNREYSSDGVSLTVVPYTETEKYIKKTEKYYRIYQKICLTNGKK